MIGDELSAPKQRVGGVNPLLIGISFLRRRLWISRSL